LYAKLFTSIYQGTLRGNSHGLLVFTNMLAHCDKTGVCDMHPRAIAEEVGLTVEQVRAALDELEGPDPDSRSPEEGGRRIVRLDGHRPWGWTVVNYLKYRAIRDEEDRREQNRKSQEAWRNRHQSKPASAAISQGKPISAHTEGEGEGEEDTEAIPGGKPPVPQQPPSTGSASGKPARKRAVKPIPPTTETWASYSQAYKERYQVEPVRNAKVNAQIVQLVGRLGADEAPGVARSYLASRNGLYVASKHCVDLLLRDCEKLRTEWVTGNVTHQRDARESDRVASIGSMVARVSANLEAKGIK
jgi:hypothetical protein